MKHVRFYGPTVVLSALLCLSVALLCGCKPQSVEDGGPVTDEPVDAMHGVEGHDQGEPGEASGPAEPSGTLTEGVRTVEVTARKFEFEPSRIVVRKGETVRLKITSEDVTHGFGLDAFDVDKELPPKETVTVGFKADEAGTHHFHCTVYCGEGHDEMHGELVVLDESQ